MFIAAFEPGQGTTISDSMEFSQGLPNGVASIDVQFGAVPGAALAIWMSAYLGQPWEPKQADKICLSFAPPDGAFLTKYTDIDRAGNNLPDGEDDIYFSRLLASTLPASDFLGDPVGYFTVVYEWAVDNDPSRVDKCLIATGEWRPRA